MGLLGGIMRAVINPATIAQLAMGPAGWASLAARSIVSAVAQSVIQQLGQKLGLPQSVINLAQDTFSQASGLPRFGGNPITEAVGQLAREGNLSPRDEGQLGFTANTAQQNLLRSLVESDDFRNARAGGNGQSFLMQIASILGRLADGKMGEMAGLAKQIGSTQDGKNANHVTELTGQMQAKGQEFSYISSALSNVVKSVGEGVAGIARK